MATEAQLALLGKGVATWNQWRRDNSDAGIDLSEANLSRVYLPSANFNGANLSGADLSSAHLLEASLLGARLTGAHLFETNLSKANLRGADLVEATAGGANLFAADLVGADLRGADLSEAILLGTALTNANLRNADLRHAELCAADLVGATLTEASLVGADLSKATLRQATLRQATLRGANLADANLRGADLRDADLTGADLHAADLRGADLRGADLTGADLSRCVAVGCDFSGANLTGCRIYAMSSWDAKLDGAVQQALHITPRHEPDIAVDGLQVAKFIALWLADEAMSQVFGTSAKRVVLILGRFSGERKAILNSLCDDLRERHYLPLVLDFGPQGVGVDLKATIAKLARLSRFVLVDVAGVANVLRALFKAITEKPWVVWQPMSQASTVDPAPLDDLISFPWGASSVPLLGC
jgi:uncharacterized protein YjbI with pentapeptide repeats